MNARRTRELVLLLATCLLGSAGSAEPPVRPAGADEPQHPPSLAATVRGDTVEEIHGIPVADPYRWLETVDGPGVQEWMRAQDEAARTRLVSLTARHTLRSRFDELLYVDWVSAPRHRGNRYFFLRRAARQEKAVLYWKEGETGPERVLVDPNRLSEDGSISLGTWSPSWDGRWVAYALRRNNADSATLYVRNVDEGRDLEQDVIADAKYANPSWTPDSGGFYYTWLPADPSIPPPELPGHAEVRFHARGTDPGTDRIVHPALLDPKKFLGAGISRDGRVLLLSIQRGWRATDVYFMDPAAKPGPRAGLGSPASKTEAAGFRPLAVGRDALYSVTAWKQAFYVHTNEGAPRYRVFKVDRRRPAREDWREIVPERSAVLDEVQVVGGRLVLTYLRNATSELEVRDLSGKLVRRVALPDLGTTNGMVGNADEDEAYFSFTSFTQVPQIFRTSAKTGRTSLWETIRIPADTSAFTVDQVFYRSKDGTRVSMFVVHRKDMARTGENPTLLTGYGGFNVSQTPSFRSTAVVWLEHGGVLAIPNLRGGGEYGEEWHRAGMLQNKQNVFDDFIAAAEHLVSDGITRPDKLAISGGSNGGLLVGAAMTQRPDLFRAVVCSVPLLDMVRYHRFGAGATWIEEYGSADDPEQFRALHAYSPYHHVRPGTSYPALLLMSADSDDRVDPMHARKFAAAVSAATTGSHPVLLRIERHAGHGGADLIRQQVERWADEYAFLLAELGVR